MAVRSTMAELITEMRLMVHDPSGDTALFSDQEIQDALDQNAYQSEYEQMVPISKVAPGGVTVYKKFVAQHAYWESDVELVSGDYAVLTPTSSDLKSGTWLFESSQNLPVLIYGVWYDMHGTAGELWGLKAGKCAEQFDSGINGDSYALHQKYDQAIAESKRHRIYSQKGCGVTHLRRSDVAS